MASEGITLADVLTRTDDWLKFAEAKNGVLLALNCAIAVGILQALGATSNTPLLLELFAAHSLLLLFVSVTLGAASFIPRLTSPWFTTFPDRPASTNVLFFGDICAHSPSSYLDEFYAVAGGQASYSKLDLQYAHQIVVNSKIAYIKYTQFSITAFFTLSAALTPVGAWLYLRAKS